MEIIIKKKVVDSARWKLFFFRFIQPEFVNNFLFPFFFLLVIISTVVDVVESRRTKFVFLLCAVCCAICHPAGGAALLHTMMSVVVPGNVCVSVCVLEMPTFLEIESSKTSAGITHI
jgi:hypothetical protein